MVHCARLRAASALAAMMLTLASPAACRGPAACPAIAAAPFVSVHVSAERAATFSSVTAWACQDGQCHGGPLALTDYAPAGQGGAGKGGQIDMKKLTESPIDLTISGMDSTGRSVSQYGLQFTPRVEHPWGDQCPLVVVASVTLDSAGLHVSSP
ncbi:hypothetical protein [Sinomonas atrocyanea]|uniref:hypothetical protein n=1 Tax=Sinomonas atrocyanea TaxID=37927 RepID=UPI003D997148